nr:PREDICTED: uncharacterized protein LOC107397453 [Tribolium castaneum]|eukprot:XP_015832987.1 PREDICTED: uncharacterized protein LOC107397453 [Tribolium castaneum]
MTEIQGFYWKSDEVTSSVAVWNRILRNARERAKSKRDATSGIALPEIYADDMLRCDFEIHAKLINVYRQIFCSPAVVVPLQQCGNKISKPSGKIIPLFQIHHTFY